jgi:hypothetical protein
MSQAVMDVCERVNVNGYDFGRADASDEEPSEDDEPRSPNRALAVNDLYPGVAVIEESPPPVVMKSCPQPQKHGGAAFTGKVSAKSVSASGTGASARNLKGSKVARSRNFQLCGKSVDSIRRGDAGKTTISAKDLYVQRKKSG